MSKRKPVCGFNDEDHVGPWQSVLNRPSREQCKNCGWIRKKRNGPVTFT